MVETRPSMSAEDFDALVTRREPNWWATGENLIYRPEIMKLEGWRSYGSPANLQLTEAQRCLMLWGDIVGQVDNGGLAQFFDNFESALEFAEAAVAQLQWPELSDRYAQCFAEYIHVDGEDATLEQWRLHRVETRERLHALVRTNLEEISGKPFSGDAEKLDWYVYILYAQGKLPIKQWDYPAIDGFNSWFYSDNCKTKSAEVITSFAKRRKDELVRIISP